MITQREQVINAMKLNGGYATFGKLNNLLDFSKWETKTPQASVRRIVQMSDDFFRIQPGLWALSMYKDDVLRKFKIKKSASSKSDELFTHSYYQGLIVEIGNMRKFSTYIPAQDQNKLFLEKPLKDLSSTVIIPEFTYPEFVKRAKTVDVIWFNERKLPNTFFEVEHSTDIQNSITKFCDLQDFYSRFIIVAPEHRHEQFKDVLKRTAFETIKKRVLFYNYDTIVNQYEIMCKLQSLPQQI